MEPPETFFDAPWFDNDPMFCATSTSRTRKSKSKILKPLPKSGDAPRLIIERVIRLTRFRG